MQTSNKLALLAGISTLAIAAPAMAQSHPVMSVTEQNTSGGTPAVPERAEQNEEIVVTGARPIAEAEATALKVQRNSDSLVTVAAADSVGRLPDQNIAQATSRLPGVAIERDQGQARYISLRGSPTTSYVGKQRRVLASRYPCADNRRRGMQSEPDGSHRQRDRSLP